MVANTCRGAKSIVALVDDHELVRQGMIKQVLARDRCVKVVGEAADVPHAISMIEQLQPDVVLRDIQLREGSGLDVAGACQTIAPETKVLIVSAHDDQQYVKSLIRMGVRGYLSKTTSGGDLRRAILDLGEGNLVFPSSVADKVLAAFKQDDGSAGRMKAKASLTRGETEVLDRISEGLTNREISTALGISMKTVDVHVRRLLLKLRAKSRTQAVASVMGAMHRPELRRCPVQPRRSKTNRSQDRPHPVGASDGRLCRVLES
jgi:DNA-binding NarL/FixJ family response regulator